MSGSFPRIPGSSSPTNSPFVDDEILMSPEIGADSYPSIPASFPHIPDRADKKQFALLLISSYIAKLVSVVRFSEKRAQQRSLDRWRYQIVGQNERCELALQHLHQRLVCLTDAWEKSAHGNILSAFYIWKETYSIAKQVEAFAQQREKLSKAHTIEMTSLGSEISSLTTQKRELEAELQSLQNKEADAQQVIASLNVQIDSDKNAIRELKLSGGVGQASGEDWKAKCKALERKNKQLKDKIWAMEQNVNGFINEMSGLLDGPAAEDELGLGSRNPSDDENTFELLRKRSSGGIKKGSGMKSQSTKKLGKSSGINLDLGRRKELGFYGSNIYN